MQETATISPECAGTTVLRPSWRRSKRWLPFTRKIPTPAWARAAINSEPVTRGRGSCGDGHPLDDDELQFLFGGTLDFEAQRDRFADAIGGLVERTRCSLPK